MNEKAATARTRKRQAKGAREMTAKDAWADGAMPQSPTDPVSHDLAVRVARRCVGIIEPLLRQEEKPEAAREFYLAVREELTAPPKERS